jgi:plasmid stabilization system protein ParE
MNFRFAPGARGDLFDLADWYEAQTTGAGVRLAAAFDDTLRRVLVNPRMYGRVARAPRGHDVRVARVGRFLVLMTYEVAATEVIILSVTHARSARRTWRRRLP